MKLPKAKPDRFLLILCILAVIFVTSIVFLLYKVSQVECASKAAMMKTEYEHGLVKGCWVKTDSGWVDYMRLIYTNVSDH